MVNNCSILDKDRIIELGSLINKNFKRLNDIDSMICNKEVIGYYLDNKLVGFVIYKTLYEVTEILYIVVDPIYRNRGIASDLISKLLRIECDKFLLEVRCDNIYAIKLYKKFNFKIINIRNKYYGNVDAYVMELIK